jgi:hypothetical protein
MGTVYPICHIRHPISENLAVADDGTVPKTCHAFNGLPNVEKIVTQCPLCTEPLNVKGMNPQYVESTRSGHDLKKM